jgi:hypothetical protein
MVREIWRATGRGKKASKALAATVDLPPLTEPDYEYLFLQLLEGVAHGWQQPRVVKFFAKLRHRVPKSQWLEWLEKFGEQLVESPNPSEDMARRMIQLSELDCGEVTNLAGEYGHRALGKLYGGYTEEFLPDGGDIELGYLPDFGLAEMEFADLESLEAAADQEDEMFSDSLLSGDLTNTALRIAHEPTIPQEDFADEPLQDHLTVPSTPEVNPFQAATDPPDSTIARSNSSSAAPLEISDDFTLPDPPAPTNFPPHPLEGRSTDTWDENSILPTFGEVPPELRLSNKRSGLPPPPSTWNPAPEAPKDNIEQIEDKSVIDDESMEERQITIEEFDMMIRSDPELLQQIAAQLGIKTNDPQVVVNHVVAQMQQQIQDNPNSQ